MTSPQFFNFRGFGYLENIFFDESKCIARIKAINHLSQDQVYLNCEIQGILEEHLFNLLPEVKKGQIVTVTFTAGYRKFITATSCFQPDDPEQIVTIHCKLLELGHCFINGHLVDKNHFQIMKAA